ncbi:hypothetical protein SAMN04489761_1101 [Tenacibaculum sp. MAR_2009_124]|uniref:hypothetical protein n=1 Tax=Tenacibaculum sp. MAR_2009_124 TaxID=1250059 RepID=UPI00089AF6CB|nr:hypothetical protein [Tenacibaculum sp. MAR_2009_124]SEB50631.1 hypothetical protein SAMN04489761_1101 [Tenacibaculum sp. MAR_2009_124]
MKRTYNKYFLLALGLALLFHGSAIFYTIELTYDALIHLFFSEHYASNWQEPWSFKWYTGFTVMGYPPLVHQMLAILSFIGGFKFALYSFSFIIIILFTTGVYRFSLLLTQNEDYAGFASMFAIFSSVFIETFHLFGQLPTLTGISLLMHSFPEIYLWIVTRKIRYLVSSFLLMGLMVCSHHVTPIFGMVFFIFPLIGLAIMDICKKIKGNYSSIRFLFFVKQLYKSLKPVLIFGFGSLVIMIGSILPYWINTKNNPITQVPIPHGSRDNFLEVLSSGLVFFLIPYGVILTLFPYVFYRFFSKRLLFFGISFSMLVLLGTGGTTPLPKMILGENAFSILTLDRFTFWASIMSYPIMGEFFIRILKRDYKVYLKRKFGRIYYGTIILLLGAIAMYFAIFTTNIGKFRPSQPQAIKMLPIINFLNQDMHYKWRYLPLGFGDQMAWLSLQTQALTVDGNYHSARRLPELTTKAVERLENSKFRGIEGIGSLQQFLANPDKFNLKYIFSKDKFYDPILYFTGWEKLSYLENGIMVWEKKNVNPLPVILTKIDTPLYQKVIWSFVPMGFVSLSIIWFIITLSFSNNHYTFRTGFIASSIRFSKSLLFYNIFLAVCGLYGMYLFYIHNTTQISSENVVKAYFDALDFKRFTQAHSYLDKNSKKSLDQFMLEISVTDGLLSSYAKLENIETKVISKTKDTTYIETKTKWITPLETIDKSEIIKTVKKNHKWYVVPKKNSKYTPANLFFDIPETTFYNQGRRKITTQQTNHEDILPQPTLYIEEAKLVTNNNQYYVLGEMQNIDYFPAAISLKAMLYDNENNELATYSSKYQNKHYLNPFEKSVFKIGFEEVAWIDSDKKDKSFNPDEFHIKIFDTKPSKFVIHASSTTAIKNLYQYSQVNDLYCTPTSVNGMLFNAGNKEVTIPQLLFAYYENNEIIWIDHQFIQESIRPHRKRKFIHTLPDISKIKVISNTTNNCYVNGRKNSMSIKDRVDMYDSIIGKKFMINKNEYNIKLQVSNFIGN